MVLVDGVVHPWNVHVLRPRGLDRLLQAKHSE